ncbi:MAG: hypothetical protein SH808_02925 [Saprospiraceae bacterium]|nr:hypothetical protein [Saprospiraceae bacterium]
MNTKMLVAGLMGGVGFFLLGWILYGMLLMDTMASYSNAACMRAEEDMNMPLLVVGNLIQGFFVAYIFSNWASISTFATGLQRGAFIGFLISLAMNCIWYATSTVMTDFTGAIIDIIVVTVMWGIVGGIVGWWLGRK